jgi:GNAT superfamily N-acetyltransferase
MVTVVPARYEHLPTLQFLFRQLIVERSEASYPAVDEEELQRFTLLMAGRIDMGHDPACCLVAEHDRKIYGFVTLQMAGRDVGKPREFAFCEWIGVVPGARAVGVGRQLVEAAVAWSEAHGVTHVEGNATIETAVSWRRRGFRDVMVRQVIGVAEARASLLVPVEERPPVGASAVPPEAPPASPGLIKDPPAPARKKRAKTTAKAKARMNGAARPEESLP